MHLHVRPTAASDSCMNVGRVGRPPQPKPGDGSRKNLENPRGKLNGIWPRKTSEEFGGNVDAGPAVCLQILLGGRVHAPRAATQVFWCFVDPQ
jgi:hypothetical protein